MKIVCIDNYNQLNGRIMTITVGEIYNAYEHNRGSYYLFDDSGMDMSYWEGYFRPLSDVRAKKLEKILE